MQKASTRGVHHLALNTEDMKSTMDFYVDVVGMPLVHAMKVPAGLGPGSGNSGNPPYEENRTYFFEKGQASLLAFFLISQGKDPRGKARRKGGVQSAAAAGSPAPFRGS